MNYQILCRLSNGNEFLFEHQFNSEEESDSFIESIGLEDARSIPVLPEYKPA